MGTTSGAGGGGGLMAMLSGLMGGMGGGGAPGMAPMPPQKPGMGSRMGNPSFYGATLQNHGQEIGKGIGDIGGMLNPPDQPGGGAPMMQGQGANPQIVQMAMELMKAGRIGPSGAPMQGGQQQGVTPRTPPTFGGGRGMMPPGY